MSHGAGLGEEFLSRAREHPLRVLDAKVEDWQDVIERAPQLPEHLSEESRVHFEAVQRRHFGEALASWTDEECAALGRAPGPGRDARCHAARVGATRR